MPVDSQAFKDALCHFPAGVTLIAIKSGEQLHGMTATAFVSVSANPPLIAVVIDDRSRAHTLLEEDGAVFSVNFLRSDQEALSRRFAFSKEDRFAEGTWLTAATGAPVLDEALTWLDCTVYARHKAGGNTIYIGEVQAVKIHENVADLAPLVYYNRCYGGVDLNVSEAQERS
jgi:flavin reductase (DIM6/NTAB) family NADH-FMN oxidoreductase RutF